MVATRVTLVCAASARLENHAASGMETRRQRTNMGTSASDPDAERDRDGEASTGWPRAPRSLVHHPQRPGEEPRQSLAQPVAPVLPVVAVAHLLEAHVHAGLLQERVDRAVVVDQRLVDPAGEI